MNPEPPEPNLPIISLDNVAVSYYLEQHGAKRKKFYAIKDVSFELYPGDSLGVIGRNGCGKSTLLQLLAGVMQPDYGSVSTLPHVRTALLSLQLGFVEYLSGRENAILNGMYLGMDKSFILSRMDEITEFSELGDFMHQPIFTYSSGMRARLGFSVALQLEPDILLVDEILGVGDAEFRDKSFRVMQDRLTSKSNTIVFVSHAAGQIRSLCNKAVWIDNGAVQQFGDVDTVVDAYEASVANKHRDEVLEKIQQGNAVFLRQEGSKTLFHIHQGKINTIHSWDEFRSLGGRTENIKLMTKSDFSSLKQDLS